MIIADQLGFGRFADKSFIALSLFLSAILQSEASSRRRLEIDESISAHLKLEHAMGVAHPRFTIAAVAPSGEEFDFNVVEANSAVTPETTTYSVNGGPPLPVRDLGVKILVSDPHNGEDSGGDMHGFTLIVVNEYTGQVNGISQVGDEKPMNIAQLGDDVVTVTGEFS